MAATKHNVKINVDKDSFTLSEPAESFSQWKSQKFRHYSTSKYYKPTHKFLLGLYSIAQFLFYPVFMVATIFFSWKFSLIPFIIFLILQTIVYAKSMKKLGEKDLLPFFILLDIWMFFYYIIFAVSLVKKPRPTWK